MPKKPNRVYWSKRMWGNYIWTKCGTCHYWFMHGHGHQELQLCLICLAIVMANPVGGLPDF